MATPKKTYSNEELNALVAEFSAEFDALVKAEVAKTGQSLSKSEPLAKEEGGDDKAPKKDGPPSDSGSDSGGGDDAPPPPAADASASAPAPAPDASASAAPAPDASAGAAPADPAAQAAGADPMAALIQAYAQLSPDELAMHFQALKQVLMTQQAGSMGGAPGAPAPAGADPMAGAAAAGGAPAPAAPAAPAPGAGAGMPPAGADSVAPLAGEGSKPVDPAAMMALKSEHEKEMNLVKSENAAKVTALEKSLAALTETLEKMVSQPIRKSVTGKDITEVLSHEKPAPKSLSKAEITEKLLKAARDTATKPADRALINNYYKGTASVEALAHLLG